MVVKEKREETKTSQKSKRLKWIIGLIGIFFFGIMLIIQISYRNQFK